MTLDLEIDPGRAVEGGSICYHENRTTAPNPQRTHGIQHKVVWNTQPAKVFLDSSFNQQNTKRDKLTVPGDSPAQPPAPLAALFLDERRHLLQETRVAGPLLVELRPLVVELSLHLALQTRIPQKLRRGRSACWVGLLKKYESGGGGQVRCLRHVEVFSQRVVKTGTEAGGIMEQSVLVRKFSHSFVHCRMQPVARLAQPAENIYCCYPPLIVPGDRTNKTHISAAPTGNIPAIPKDESKSIGLQRCLRQSTSPPTPTPLGLPSPKRQNVQYSPPSQP